VLTGIKANDNTKRTNKEIEYIKSLHEKKVKEKWLKNQNIKSKTQSDRRECFANDFVKHEFPHNRNKKG